MCLPRGDSLTQHIRAYKSFLSMSFHLLSDFFSRVHTDGSGLREREVEGNTFIVCSLQMFQRLTLDYI